MKTGLIQPIEAKYDEYLGDESKLKGYADSISFAQSKEEIAQIIVHLSEASIPVTVQGGRTGICGGAVPLGGHILNLSRMNRITGLRKTGDGYIIRVQAGVLLSELDQRLNDLRFDTTGWDAESLDALASLKKDRPYFFPPEPTETSATIGGVLATNAQGICADLYGPTKQYVQGVVFIDGQGRESVYERGTSDDLIDTLVGSEGLYGIIAEAELRLIKRPREQWGIVFFFEEQKDLFAFAQALPQVPDKEGTAAIAAMEYIDKTTLAYIARLKKVATKLKALPDVDEAVCGLVYAELHGDEEADIEAIALRLMELAAQYGCGDESTWALSGRDEIEKLRALRHAAPESINIALEQYSRADSRITKLSTDIALPGKQFGEAIAAYQQDARGKRNRGGNFRTYCAQSRTCEPDSQKLRRI